MTGLPAFVAELVMAANQFDRLGEFEKRRLLDRAYRTIEEARDEVGLSGRRGADYDEAIDLLTMSRAFDQFSDDEIREAMLSAANMLRNLKIILDAKAAVLRGE